MSPSTTHLFIFCISCPAETGIHTYGMLSHVGTWHAGSCSSTENSCKYSGHPTRISFLIWISTACEMDVSGGFATPCSWMEAPLPLHTLTFLMHAIKRQRASSYILCIYCEAQQRHNKTDKWLNQFFFLVSRTLFSLFFPKVNFSMELQFTQML